mgnify:CR=1 FL=1
MIATFYPRRNGAQSRGLHSFFPTKNRTGKNHPVAQSHVKVSFEVPEYTADADAVGTLRILEAIRMAGLAKTCRFYQASTSELFGKVQETPQRETTPFYPYSPYAAAKQYAYWIVKNYREAYGMFAVNGILFNHESERRGESFVTRTASASAVYSGTSKETLTWLCAARL